MMCQNIGWTTVIERGNAFARPSPKTEEAPEHTASLLVLTKKCQNPKVRNIYFWYNSVRLM